VSAAAAIAQAEAAGLRLWLRPDGQVEVEAAKPLPPDVLAELRRWREDVAHLLALRGAAAGQQSETAVWLSSIARSIRAALADGAVRAADEDGWLLLLRPDGRRTVVRPETVAQLAEAGILPTLLAAVGEPAGDDPDADAERAAIQGEPPLPPEGTPERERLDTKQAEAVRRLLETALVRPSCFAGEARRPPTAGSHCATYRGRRWWFPARPAKDGTTPSPHWRCAACRPPGHLAPGDRVEART
jgi:hypothetical protein